MEGCKLSGVLYPKTVTDVSIAVGSASAAERASERLYALEPAHNLEIARRVQDPTVVVTTEYETYIEQMERTKKAREGVRSLFECGWRVLMHGLTS